MNFVIFLRVALKLFSVMSCPPRQILATLLASSSMFSRADCSLCLFLDAFNDFWTNATVNLSQSSIDECLWENIAVAEDRLLIDNDGQRSKMSWALLAYCACRLLLHTSRSVIKLKHRQTQRFTMVMYVLYQYIRGVSFKPELEALRLLQV